MPVTARCGLVDRGLQHARARARTSSRSRPSRRSAARALSRRCITSRSSVSDSTARMRGAQHGAARRLVDAARLHADVAVLDQVDAADAVARRAIVLSRASSAAGARRSPFTATGSPASKSISTSSALVGRLLGRDRELEHVVVRRAPRVLEDAALVAHVQQVAVGASRASRAVTGDRDAVLLGVGDQVGAPVEVPRRATAR